MQRIACVANVGRQSYSSGLKIQEFVSNMIKSWSQLNDTKGIIILVEHDPVYTVGIRNRDYDIEYEKRLRSLGAEFFRTGRGGLITFHGPGQLVSYPILNLKCFEPSVRWYVTQLEQVIISTCADFGIKASTSPHTGVWVNDKKICAMGLRVSQYITSHGLALNCETDLNWFNHIVPCGIPNKGVTSLTVECGKRISIGDATSHFLKNFEQLFDCRVKYCTEDILHEILSKSKSL